MLRLVQFLSLAGRVVDKERPMEPLRKTGPRTTSAGGQIPKFRSTLDMLDGAARRQIRYRTVSAAYGSGNAGLRLIARYLDRRAKRYTGLRYPWIARDQQASSTRASRHYRQTRPDTKASSSVSRLIINCIRWENRPPSSPYFFSSLFFPFLIPRCSPSLLLPVFPPSCHRSFIALFHRFLFSPSLEDKVGETKVPPLPQTRCSALVLCDRCRSLIPSVLCVSSTFPFQSNPVD